jgi:hypothetical protein
LRFAKRQQIREQYVQSVDFLNNQIEITLTNLATYELLLEHLHRQPDAVQRISDLMGNVCRKAADGA